MRARAIAGAIVATLVTLAAIEVALRLAGLIPLSSATYIPDAATGFKLQPHAGTDADGFNNPATENDPNPARTARPGTVLFVGDSFVFGTYPAEAVFPILVIADLAGNGVAARAVNVGIPGAGPDTYVRVMRAYVPRLEPVAVVATVYLGNDVEQGDPRRPTKLWLGRIGNYAHPLSFHWDELMIVAVGGKLLRLAEEALHRRHAPDTAASGPEEAGRRSLAFTDAALARIRWRELEAARIVPDRRIARGYEGLAARLADMATIAQASGATFLVALAPSRVGIDAKLRAQVIAEFGGDPHDFDGALPSRRMGEALTARGISFVNLAPPLAAAGPARVYNRADTHWNRRGNALAAEAIADALAPLLARK